MGIDFINKMGIVDIKANIKIRHKLISMHYECTENEGIDRMSHGTNMPCKHADGDVVYLI